MKISRQLFQELVNRAYALALEVHYQDVSEEGTEQSLLDLLRFLRTTLQVEPDSYGVYDDPQLTLGPEEPPRRKPDYLGVDHRGRPVKARAERPSTTTRGLPFVISPDLARLRRLKREWDHCARWHAPISRSMLDGQCESLHRRVYPDSPICYYGPLPSGPDYSFLRY